MEGWGGGGGVFVVFAELGEKVAAEVGPARIEDRADLNKKYPVEVNARLVKFIGTVKVKRFPRRRGVTCKALSLMMG